MATLNFPAQPQTIGNTYTFNNKTWVWNGQGWALTSELTNLTVTGNINTGNLISSGIVSAASFVGNISGNIDAAGSNTQVQFNDTGDILGASANFTFNKSTNVLSVTGTIQGTTLSATGNVTGGNVISNALVQGVTVTATGNLVGGNANITSAVNSATVSATGNITGGNLKTANITISSDSIVSANSIITIDPSAAGATGLVVIAGNLQVQGTTTTIDSTTVTINDLMINVANNAATASQANLGGIGVGPAGSEYAKWIYNNTANAWTTDIGISVTGNANVGNIITSGNTQSTNLSLSGNVIGTGSQTGIKGQTSGIAGNNLSSLAWISNIANINFGGQPNNNDDVVAVFAYQDKFQIQAITNGLTKDALDWTVSTNTITSSVSNFTVIGNITSDSGNITGNYFFGNGSQLTGIDATSIQSGTSNVRVLTSGGNVAVGIGGTSNIAVFSNSGVDVIGRVSATGNITGGNLSVGIGTIDSGNILPAANITYDLGSTSQRWRDLWLSNSSIYIGGAVIGATGTALTVNGANVLVGNAGAAFSTSGNITGGNLLTSGLISATGNLVGGNANITLAVNSATVSASGNITGGNLSVSTGTVSVGNIVNTNANGVGNIGSATVYYNTVFAKATSAQYADVAEKYLADQDYAVGTVLVFGGDREVTQSTTTHQTSIAGTVSENPSYIMNAGLDGESVVTLALLGRVPVRVKGAISKGDLLVASSTPGVACRMDPAQYSPGCVIGKALANHEENGPGWIEAVVGRI